MNALLFALAVVVLLALTVPAVAYFEVVDATKSLVAIENVVVAIDQIAQTTLRKVVGQHTLDETDRINVDIREILVPIAPMATPLNGATVGP